MAFRGTGLGPLFGTTPLFSLRREIDRIFDDAVGGTNGRERAEWAPPVDVREDQKEILLQVELPGIRPEQVDISVDNGVLTIRGEKREERKEGGENGRYHIIERRYGSFSRSVMLPSGIDEDQIAAGFDQGVLTIRIPKAALPQPKRIQIESAGSSGEKGVTSGEKRETAKRG